MQDTVAVLAKALQYRAILPWIHTAQVYYWVILTPTDSGFAYLRATGVQTSSLLMDLPTLQQFQDLWATEAKPFRGERPLTTAEAEAYTYYLPIPVCG